MTLQPPLLSKDELRATALEWRASLDKERREQAAQRLVVRALQAIDAKASDSIAGYWPIRSELDPRPLMHALQKKGHALALPVIEGETILFRKWSFNSSLEVGAFSTSEPCASSPEVKPNIILVPLVAFDTARNRLGYGKGYYDRALSRLRATMQVRMIGLAYEGQKLEHIPAESHDQGLDMIITDETIY